MRLTRRRVLRDGAAATAAVFVTRDLYGLGDVAVAVEPGRPSFLGEQEMGALRGLVDRFVPGPPDDLDQGALAAGCAEAIDALLGAFQADPPLIFAGAPFSDRAGHPVNNFKEFLRLDPYEAKGWRLRIEGSQGNPALEFNGPVKGWQEIYRDGLAGLDREAGGSFGDLLGPQRDLILRRGGPGIEGLVDVAFPHTLHFMYGAPEYHGNRDLIGWRYTKWQGDRQPRGWTPEEISEPDPPGLSELLPGPPETIPMEDLLDLAPLASSPEAAHTMMIRSGGTLEGMREELRPVLEELRRRKRRRRNGR